MLVVNGLKKSYGANCAVDGVSFTVPSGISFGLLGPNGAGKTTTISMIAGTIDADEGSVSLDGVPIGTNARAAKRRIGYVPQELAIFEDLSATRNLHFFGALYGLFGKEIDQAKERVLDLVGLSERADEPVKAFSGGMKRRLNIAVGLLHNPDLLIFDEPTVGVDPQTRNSIFECLSQLAAEGKTILYTTHYMEEVERLCDEAAIMDHGKVVASGRLAELQSLLARQNEVTIELESVEFLKSVVEVPGAQSWQVEGRILTLRLFDLENSLSNAFAWLVDQGAQIRGIETKRVSLEHVFLELTGKSLRD